MGTQSAPSPLKATAILVGAGGASRMGLDKLLAPLGGVPVLVRTVRRFMECPEVSQLIVVTTPARWAVLQEHGLADSCVWIAGGADRHLSVLEGLTMANLPLVAVHDAARPLVSSAMISQCLQAAQQYGAAALARPVTETVKRADASGVVTASVDRTRLWLMETPQCFRTQLLRDAYAEVVQQGGVPTDEVSVLQESGRAVHLVPNPSPNPKITFPSDLILAEKLLEI